MFGAALHCAVNVWGCALSKQYCDGVGTGEDYERSRQFMKGNATMCLQRAFYNGHSVSLCCACLLQLCCAHASCIDVYTDGVKTRLARHSCLQMRRNKGIMQHLPCVSCKHRQMSACSILNRITGERCCCNVTAMYLRTLLNIASSRQMTRHPKTCLA